MLPWLAIIAPLPALAALDKAHGVAPTLLSHYAPIAGSSPPQWRCLDGTKTIPWSAVNDDYCDCPDGSDEPGTNACPNTTFHCRNEGHIGATIPSSRVNDGLCEAECCDGSDETTSGANCPNVCKEVGEAYRLKFEAQEKARKTGAKIRSTYISFAKKEQKRLEAQIVSAEQEVAVREKEVSRLKGILEWAESVSASELEHKKKSPLYDSLLTHKNALRSLKREHTKLQEKEKKLSEILATLRTGYNPNYQDMAVLDAVRSYEEYARLPHINDAEGEEGEDDDQVKVEPEEEVEEGMWTSSQLQWQLDPLLNADSVNLLLQHDTHVNELHKASTLFDVSSYLPEVAKPWYDDVRASFMWWLDLFGFGSSNDSNEQTAQARTAFQEAERLLNDAIKLKQDGETELKDLYDPEMFGSEGEWKKLENTCLSKDTGEYTYEVCLFKQARQIPNNGGTTFSLGNFATWHPDLNIEVGTPEFYSRQVYSGGVRCWNGPDRTVTLVLECGTENAILSVSEPQKCEYELTGTTPALCLPSTQDSPKSEL